MLACQLFHGGGVKQIALLLVAYSGIENLQGCEVVAFACGFCLGRALLGRLAQLCQYIPARPLIKLVPQRMVVGHRLTPHGHDEIRFQRLRLLESLGGFVVLEQMQQQGSPHEGLLRLRGFCAGGKFQGAQARHRCGSLGLVRSQRQAKDGKPHQCRQQQHSTQDF